MKADQLKRMDTPNTRGRGSGPPPANPAAPLNKGGDET